MNPIRILTVICCILFLVSCENSRYIYAPSPASIPYFKEKGESKLTALYSESDATANGYARGWDLQGAYALSDHFAITASYFNRREQDKTNNNFASSFPATIDYKRNLGGIGLGYFVPLNAKKTITFNLYVGGEFGKFSFQDKGDPNQNPGYNRNYESGISKGFFQPSFNFMPGDYVRFAVFLKSSYVGYRNIKTDYTSDELKYYGLEHLGDRTWSFLEYGWNFQFGIPKYPWIRLEMSVSSVNWGREIYYLNNRPINIRYNNFSVGLNFDFSKMH